ncbi:MAG TPA: hypothetical protein VEZ20_05470 [Allosphingosinicella sp.]|jgi:hypothetical protein|nr:hypothetical protein [Allosphingosinicella sp.]
MNRMVRQSLKRALVLLGLCLTAPGIAAAGPVAELACLEQAISAEQSSALVSGVGEGRVAPKQDLQPGVAAVVACARRFEWTRAEVQAASHYMPALFAQRRFRAELAGQSLDLAWVEREVAADEALVAAAGELRGTPPELMAFLTRIAPSIAEWQVRHSEDRAALTAFGGFVAATALVEGTRRRFAR